MPWLNSLDWPDQTPDVKLHSENELIDDSEHLQSLVRNIFQAARYNARFSEMCDFTSAPWTLLYWNWNYNGLVLKGMLESGISNIATCYY